MSGHDTLIAEARSTASAIDPAWKFDDHETEQWTLLREDVLALADAVEAAEKSGLPEDGYDVLIDRAGRHAEDIDHEWYICGTEAESSLLYGEQARWAALAHAIWNLTEALLEMRFAKRRAAAAQG
jgi:hypothetical protein